MKKIIAVFVCIYSLSLFTACTNSKDDEASDQPTADASVSTDNPDGSAAVGTDGKPVGNPDEAQAGFLDDQLPDDSANADKSKDSAAAAPSAEKPPLSVDENPTTPPPAVAGDEAKDTKAAEPVPENIEKNEAPKPAPVSLQKVKDAPFHQGDQLLNAVYIARPGDDYKKISTMVYGSTDKVADLKKANPSMKKPKPGQKVYYNSPQRPQDESKLLTYYEDTGVPAQTYIAKDGDNMHQVAQQLLGYPEAWKEVWATNSVQSKGKMPAGTELRYWKGPVAANMTEPEKTADMNMPPPPPLNGKDANSAATMGPPPPKMPDLPPPPPQQVQQPEAALPPPPPPTMAENKIPDLPPPPAPQQAPTAMARKSKGTAPADEMMDQDTMMALAGAGIVALGLAAVIVIRKRRAQRSGGVFESNVGS